MLTHIENREGEIKKNANYVRSYYNIKNVHLLF